MNRAWDEAAELAQYPDPEPLPTGLPPVAPFQADLLPAGLRGYVMDIAERLQCPPDFPAIGFVTVLSGLIGGRLGVRPKAHDDWLVVPNLWGAIVGRPSVMKTPALQEPVKMLHRLEVLARGLYADRKTTHDAEMELHKAQFSANKKKAESLLKKGGDKGNVIELLRREQPPTPPTERRYIVNDCTTEKLGEILQENPAGVLLFRDELVGWLKSLDRDGREGDRAFYLESWTGAKSFTYDRIGRGTVHIDSVTVAMLGGIQPGPLRDYVSAALRGGAGNDGLLQRFQLLVWPDVSSKWRNVDRWPDTDAKNAVWRIIERIDGLNVHHEEGETPSTRFSAEAQEAFDSWRADLEHRLRNEQMAEVMEAHMGKYRSLVPSLALIFHMVDEQMAMAPIKLDHLRRAIAWAKYLETHARRVYSQALEPGMAAALALVDRLVALPEEFTARDIYRHGWAGLDREGTEKALAVLLDYGQIVALEGEGKSGRPSQLYRVNPKKNNSENLRRRADKTAKSTESGGFVSFGGPLNQEYENNFSDGCPQCHGAGCPLCWPDDELMDGEA